MNSISKFAALAAVSAISSACAAAVIDDFSTTSVLSKTGPGTNTQTTIAVDAIGGSRFESVGVTTGGGTAILKINSPLLGIGAMSSETGVNSLFGLTYGNAADLNANFSLSNAFTIRMEKSDIGSVNNSITVFTTGIGSATATFVLPALVGLGGPASPFDVTVPFASFTGAAVNFGNIDKISYSFNPTDSADWQIQLLGTSSVVPAPSAAIGGFVLLVGLSAIRLRKTQKARA